MYDRGGAIPQLVEQWSRNLVTRVRNQVDALMLFGKALILITSSLGEDLKGNKKFWEILKIGWIVILYNLDIFGCPYECIISTKKLSL